MHALAGTWVELTAQQVSTADVSWTWADLLAHVQVDGTLELRVQASGTSSTRTRSDLLTASVTRRG